MSRPIAVVTGSGGLVGSAITEQLIRWGYQVIGVDSNKREEFFGPAATVVPTITNLKQRFTTDEYVHVYADVQTFVACWHQHVPRPPAAIVHCAAQPSHDYAVMDPAEDWRINATCTRDLLEMTRKKSPEAAFVFLSTNKVYGDRINYEPFIRSGDRMDLSMGHPFWNGVPETFSVDQTKHSLFGASKLAADVLVQEYGQYFGMRTGVFRGGCLSGARHAGVPLHGFLSYLVRCIMRGEPYTVIGYQGLQVRDNIDSVDLSEAIMAFIDDPDPGAVYNIGGGRANSVSVLEAAQMVSEVTGKEAKLLFEPQARIGDHRWWITDLTKFRTRYPEWRIRTSVQEVIQNIVAWEQHDKSHQNQTQKVRR